MISVRVLTTAGLQSGGLELLETEGPRWVDVLSPTREELERLAQHFGLHALAIEDCLHLGQRPKLEEYPGHQFIVLHGFSCEHCTLETLTMNEMHLFLGPTWLISVHQESTAQLVAATQKVQADPQGTLGRGVDFVAYLLSDALVDANFALMDAFNDELEDLQDSMFAKPSETLLHRAFALKRQLVLLRRVMSPQRDVVGLLARNGIAHVSDRTSLYFRDIFDHLIRLYEQIESARDMLSNIMEAYLSVVANRTNEIMKQLTVFSSIFLPLGFIVGFFGQNFEGLNGPGSLIAMVALIAIVPVAMVLYFRRRGWF